MLFSPSNPFQSNVLVQVSHLYPASHVSNFNFDLFYLPPIRHFLFKMSIRVYPLEKLADCITIIVVT